MARHETSEGDLLLDRLSGQRNHVLRQLEGLSDEQLRQPVLPSGWSCLGLVRHLTLSDERYCSRSWVAGEPLDFWPAGANGDWQVGADEAVADVLAAYSHAIARSNEIIAARRLSDPPTPRSGATGSPRRLAPSSQSRVLANSVGTVGLGLHGT